MSAQGPARHCPDGVSIIIPNWNHELVLPRSFASALKTLELLQREGRACEILLLDDASRDGSRVLLRQLEAIYAEREVRVIFVGANEGISALRNRGLRLAKYRHVLFLDADNEVVPENIPTLSRAITDTSAACAYGNLLVEGDGHFFHLYSGETVQEKLFAGNYIDVLALYDRLQLLDLDGFQDSSEMKAHEDWELLLHLAASGREILFVPILAGIYHHMEVSHVFETRDELQTRRREVYVRRVFDQLGIRSETRLRAKNRRYHPDLGYL